MSKGPLPKVTIASHYFKIKVHNDQDYQVIRKFSRRFQDVVKQRDGTYQAVEFSIFNYVDKVFHFHINAYPDFQEFLKTHPLSQPHVEIEVLPLNKGKTVDLKVKKDFSPRDYQVPIIEYFQTKKYDRGVFEGSLLKQNFIGIQTGEGKTITSAFCAQSLGKRVLICVRPLFLKKWAQDIFNIFQVKKNETIAVAGNKQLKGLISIAKTKEFEKVKIILVSLPTLRNWFSLYERKGSQAARDDGYDIEPDELYQHLDVGLRIIDEVHIDFHFNFIHDLFTHTQKTLSLSATLSHMDAFTKKMQDVAYPPEYRYQGGELKKYTKAFAIIYNVGANRWIQTTDFGSTTYSHVAFEKSIMSKKNPSLLENYCGLVLDTLNISFLPNFKKGQKAVVYAVTKDMCTHIVKFLAKHLPKLNVKRYVMEDPYENLMDADIRVTTLLSGGTGHDIKGLTDVVMTTCIQSIEQNIQALGRLREIPDGETRFWYFACACVEKQMRYHYEKRLMLLERAKSYEIMPYGLVL